MSHSVEIKTKLHNKEALITAVNKCGLEWVEGCKHATQYIGRKVKADHVIRVPNNSSAYQIAVLEKEGVFTLSLDSYSGGRGMSALAGDNGEKIIQQYGATLVENDTDVQALIAQGYAVVQSTDPVTNDLIIDITNEGQELAINC